MLPEIVDAITDPLHNDRSTLAALALVSTGWVSASRQHLFYKVELVPHTWDGNQFLAILQSPFCSIASSVRELDLNAFGPRKSERCDSYDGAALARSLAERLPQIRSLSVSLHGLPESPTLFVFPLLTSLTVVMTWVQYRSHFLQVILAHPLLEKLIIHGLHIADESPLPSSLRRQEFAPLLKVFNLTADLPADLAELFIPHNDESREFTIDFVVSCYDHMIRLRRYISLAGSSLRHLHINFLPCWTMSPLPSYNLFSDLPNLQSLELIVYCHSRVTASWLTAILDGVTVPLENIKIEFDAESEEDLDTVDWHQLDIEIVRWRDSLKGAIMLHRNLATARSNQSLSTSWKALMEARLPKSASRGLLRAEENQ